MHTDPEINENVRKILVIKRYEAPPPGYFNQLPNRIMSRLYAEIERERLPWFQRWWMALESRPAFAGAFGLVMCGVLVGGVVFSEGMDVPQNGFAVVGPRTASDDENSGNVLAESSKPWDLMAPVAEVSNMSFDSYSSTDPLVAPQSGLDLFRYQDERGETIPVSY
jgi:hypothetical protein